MPNSRSLKTSAPSSTSRPAAIAAAWCLCLATVSVACAIDNDGRESLREYGFDANPKGIRHLLRLMVPSATTRREIKSYVDMLGDDDFRIRQRAMTTLMKFPVIPDELVDDSLDTADLEVNMRMLHVARSRNQRLHQILMRDALDVIREQRIAGLTTLLIAALELHSDESTMWESARHAMNATAVAADVDQLRAGAKSSSALVRSAVVAPYLRLAGNKQTNEFAALLEDDHERVRLAAAIAFANIGSRDSLSAFVELINSSDASVRLASIRSLRHLTNQDFGFNALAPAESRTAATRQWKSWIRRHRQSVKLNTPLRESWKIQLLNSPELPEWQVIESGVARPCNQVGLRVRNGVLSVPANLNCRMRTIEGFRNYELRYEWRWPKNEFNDAGLLILLDEKDTGTGNGLEVQLHNQHAGDFYRLGTFTNEGTMPTGVNSRLTDGQENPLGHWNEMRIKVIRGRVNVHINGRLHNEAKGVPEEARRIGIRIEGYPIEFRRMELTPLD